MNIRAISSILVALYLPLAGCQVLYDSAVADKESDCEKLVSQSRVQECKQKVRDQIATYRREQSEKTSSKTKSEKDGLCYVKATTGEKVCPN